ncbi:hypothetical protein BCR33DRAFT_720066 [Rhizoclosmatium globosum]|uniref:Uncharacterized protein n=1 Tax=Rhizoclosmatium globosum TaxID=329046 RepID=A0A1Y2BXZ6_9FUNG|nr:hypothetical protein BCR33DRAFT_720066 [Rhizoclosmatium globosum]|eukprot:ORY39616.1 hypothetical protein BCR33DRAFT_720066 [Rhizoclosmatium globosum]
MGRDFATKHLKDYDFNTQFKIDAARSASAFIAALDGLGSPVPEDRDDAESLLAHICAPSLAAKYIASTKQLDALNLRANFKLIPKSSSSSQSQSTSTSTSSSIIPSTTSTAIDLPKSPSSKALLASDPRFASLPPIPSHISSWHWIFGPCPPPPDHLYQHWLNFYTLVIPQDVSTLMEYHELKDIKNRAIDEGIFVRIYVSFDVNVAVTLSDVRTGIPVYKDVRKGFDLQVTSPHYTPWDEVLEPFAPGAGVEMGQGSFWKPNQRTEEWRLKWDWRVCDVDYLTYVPVGHSVNLWGGGGGSKQ